jgi:tRNA A-37 threonylcarbamoyl transferase component Bud32
MKNAHGPTGEVLSGTYRIEGLLGKGNMGSVYEATHLRLPRRFAVKLLAAEVASDATALSRFQREAEVTGRIGHPNIVEVVDFNTAADGRPYLVMELLEGESLGSYLARRNRLDPAEVDPILQQVASGLQAAHDCDIVHRDLKPSNIFLCKPPAGESAAAQSPRIKIVDFGISKVLGVKSDLTTSASVYGTPHYMAPEQADGRHREIDRRTDIYAVGVILYEALTGRTPFAGEPALTVLYKTVHDQVPPLTEVRPEIPAPVAQVVARALERQPSSRFDSVAALAEAYTRALRGQVPVGEQDPTTTYKMRPVGHRRPGPWRMAALLVATLLLAAAVAALYYLPGELPAAPLGANGSHVATVAPAPDLAPSVAPLGPDAASTVAPDAGQPDGPPPVAIARPDAGPKALPRRARKPAKRTIRPVKRRAARAKLARPTLVPIRITTAGGWAHLEVDGRRRGDTPVDLSLPPGRHRIRVFRAGKEKTKTIELRPGKRRNLHLVPE